MPGLPGKFMSSRLPAAPPTQLDAGALGFGQSDVIRDRKFGERRHGPTLGVRRCSVRRTFLLDVCTASLQFRLSCQFSPMMRKVRVGGPVVACKLKECAACHSRVGPSHLNQHRMQSYRARTEL
jgi:hypothetical protein